jgi:hypothetical protein
VAAFAAALLTCAATLPAARAHAQAADPFPEVPLPAAQKHSSGWALISFASGAGLVAASFGIADAADRRYTEYLHATDPAQIQDLYNQAVLFDRLSTASIITGEVLIATGVYLAFLRRPEPPRLGLALEPSRCGFFYRF